MTVSYTSGDIFASHARALVIPVNCWGVIGTGLVKEFSLRYPSVYTSYVDACWEGTLRPGKVYVTRSADETDPGRIIINLPIKDHWNHPSTYEFLYDGLMAMTAVLSEMEITDVAIPALGCGRDGLEWKQVMRIIDDVLADHKKIHAEVYAPG